jgi:hypothetical protein
MSWAHGATWYLNIEKYFSKKINLNIFNFIFHIPLRTPKDSLGIGKIRNNPFDYQTLKSSTGL